MSTITTMTGNLVDDPQLRYTPTGQAVASFRIADTPRRQNKQTGDWEDGDTVFMSCSIWRQAAENVAESLQRGMRVIVTGKLTQRSYETREGEKRTVYEIAVDEIGPSLRNASAKVTKTSRSTGGQQAPAAGGPQSADDPWASNAGGDGGYSSEPPF